MVADVTAVATMVVTTTVVTITVVTTAAAEQQDRPDLSDLITLAVPNLLAVLSPLVVPAHRVPWVLSAQQVQRVQQGPPVLP